MSKSSEPVTPFVVSDPGILGGEPVIAGTRVPFSSLMRLVKEHYPSAVDTVTQALSSSSGSGNDKLPMPSLPVESLEALNAHLWEMRHELNNNPETSNYIEVEEWGKIVDQIETLVASEKQKARIDLLDHLSQNGHGGGNWRRLIELERAKGELREESNE